MPHRPKNRGSRTEAPPATADAELRRHLNALGLESVEAYRAWCRQHGFRTGTRKSWQEQRQEREAFRKEEAATAAQAEVARHIQALGLESLDEYRSWCRRHGFSDSANKTPQQRRQEQLVAGRSKAAATLSSSRRHTRRLDETLRRISRGEIDARELSSPSLQRIHELFTAAADRPEIREALLRLLLHAQKHADLFSIEPAAQYLGWQAGNSLLDGLLALAGHHEDWLRPPEEWRPDSHNARRQFGSLARHLLARYDVPVFMDAAWFEGSSSQALRHQQWFKHIGIGQNIRTADLPLRLTKMMAHHFLQAPDDYSIEAALRCGQILGLGGDEPLVRAVIGTRLGETDEHEEFWVTVLQFFINNPMLDPACIGPIIDYVHHQKYVPRALIAEAGPLAGDRVPEDAAPLDAGPPQPEFSTKGRTVPALLRLVDRWHGELAREARKRPSQWEPSGIGSFRLIEEQPDSGRPVCWTIQEILTSTELREEGKAMNHCVASYARSCARGHTSIWSMRVQEGQAGSSRRAMTIAVHNARRTVTQARGRCNRLPGAKGASIRLNLAPEILQQWAKQEGLIVPKHL